MMKKHAILLLAHNEPQYLMDLIDLFDENFYFFIHLDKHCDFSVEDIEKIKNNPKVKFLKKKYNIHWGGFSIIKGFLLLGKKAISFPDIGYVHLMSGQDIPLKSSKDIVEFFQKNDGKQFLHHFKLPSKLWNQDGGLERLRYYHFYDLINGKKQMNYRINKYLVLGQKFLGMDRHFSKLKMDLYGGSCWLSITMQCFEYCLDFVEKNPEYTKAMKYTFAPDEFFFHILIMNSPFKKTVVNDNLYYIDWENSKGSSPEILNESHFDSLINSGKLFARKISSPTSDDLKSKLLQSIRIDQGEN